MKERKHAIFFSSSLSFRPILNFFVQRSLLHRPHFVLRVILTSLHHYVLILLPILLILRCLRHRAGKSALYKARRLASRVIFGRFGVSIGSNFSTVIGNDNSPLLPRRSPHTLLLLGSALQIRLDLRQFLFLARLSSPENDIFFRSLFRSLDLALEVQKFRNTNSFSGKR